MWLTIIIIGVALFTLLFMYALKPKIKKQTKEEWDTMMQEKDRVVYNANGDFEYKFGDILLLLPTKSDGTDHSTLNLAKYLSNVARLLNRQLKKAQANETLIKIIDNTLTFENIENLMNDLLNLIDMRYLHVEIYLGGGWTIGANGDMVCIRKIRDVDLENYDVYRMKEIVVEDELLPIIKKYWNRPYDYFSMSLSGFLNLFGYKKTKHKFYYDNEEKLMCSEFVARVFNDFYEKPIFLNPEMTIPDNFATLPEYLDVIYYDKNCERNPSYNDLYNEE